MNTKNIIHVLALTNPVTVAAVTLAALVVLLVVCVYFAVGYIASRLLVAQFKRRSTQLSFACVVHDATGLEAQDVNDLLEWFEFDAITEQDEHAPLTVGEAAAPYGWTTLDLPTQPTPSGIFGHDEHGNGELIETTPADDESLAVPAQAARVLLAPSAAQTTTPAAKRKPKAAQMEAARQLLAEGKPVRAIARELVVPESTIRSWRKKFIAEAAV